MANVVKAPLSTIGWDEKKFFLKLKNWPLQKVGKWSETPSYIEIFLLLPLVVEQHKTKDQALVKFSQNALTL